jgi:hypothetical protein
MKAILCYLFLHVLTLKVLVIEENGLKIESNEMQLKNGKGSKMESIMDCLLDEKCRFNV